MRPFVNYRGGKWTMARRYGPPQRDRVVEVFAGFAGYSTYWEPKQVTLIEADQIVVGVWRYLQRATPQEIMALPTDIDSLAELPPQVCEEARNLIVRSSGVLRRILQTIGLERRQKDVTSLGSVLRAGIERQRERTS